MDFERFSFASLCFLSITGLIFIAITIFRNPKLQAHPQKLIAYICVVEACMSWNALMQVIGPVLVLCYFGAEQIWSYTVPNQSMDEAGLMKSLNTLCISNGLTFQTLQILSLFLNICLCADLILTIWSPFTPASSRVKYYLLGGISLPLIMIIQTIVVKKNEGDGEY